MLSHSFIGGFISSCGSFLEYTRNGRSYFGFQIKTSINNSNLLNRVAAFFEINNHVYNNRNKKQTYALLIVRNRQVIEKQLIPFFDEYLEGVKKQQYLDWKSRFYKNSSMWNYRNVTSVGNPDIYTIVDKNPYND